MLEHFKQCAENTKMAEGTEEFVIILPLTKGSKYTHAQDCTCT